MIRETCSCGATFECRLPNSNTTAAAQWRADHKCVEPVTLTELHDSGPGLADVIDRLATISEHVALIGRIVAKDRR